MSSKKPFNPKLKKFLLLILKLSVSGGALYLILSKAGVDKVFSHLRTISPWAFAFAIFTYIASIFISSFRWQLLLPEHFSVKRLFPLYMLGAFFNTFLPGLVGGDAVKIYYLYKETGKGTQALSSVFMDRFVGFTMLMTLGITAYPFGYEHFKDYEIGGVKIAWVTPLIVLTFALVSLLIFGLRLGQRFQVIKEVHNYFHSYLRKPGIIIKALILSAIVQVAIIFSVYVLTLGLGISVSFITLLVFVPIITTISTIPISISGIGLREGASVVLLGAVGIDPSMATALSFSMFLAVAIGSLPGIFEYLRKKDYDVPKA